MASRTAILCLLAGLAVVGPPRAAAQSPAVPPPDPTIASPFLTRPDPYPLGGVPYPNLSPAAPGRMA